MKTKDDYLSTNQKGIWKRFFKMLIRGRLPYIWIILYIALSFGLTNVGISATEYTAEMFAGNVSFTGVIMPFILFSLISLLIGTVSGVAYFICTSLIDRNMRRMVWRKIVHLPMSFYDTNESTELLSRITTDTASISVLVMQVMVSCITGIYSLTALLLKIFSYSTGLMLALLVYIPFMIAIPAILGKFNFGINNKVNEKNAELTQYISEKVEQIETVKAFSAEDAETDAGKIKMKGLYRYVIKNSWLSQLTTPLYAISGLIQAIIIILVGRYYYMQGAITLTQWIAFFAFSESVSANLSAYAGYWDAFKIAQGSTNRVTQIMELPEEDLTSKDNESKLSGSIQFQNVSFSYNGKSTIFDKINLTVPEGKRTVIAGPSGGGKSTVINLIERFYSPGEGTIRIGEQDISGLSLKEYRRHFTCITQNSVPVSGTIRDNLLYGLDKSCSDEELLDACRKAGAYDFIAESEKGLDSAVGANGSNLSGGQRQKLALAKVFLRDTDYIILDEATSAVDVKSSQCFFENLCREKAGKTILIIAHNAQAIQYGQHLIILSDGCIEASGSPEAVRLKSRFARELWGRDGKKNEEK